MTQAAEKLALVLLTVAVYRITLGLHRRTQAPPLHPVVLTPALLIGLLLLAGIPYRVYRQATAPITDLLGPATVALAVLLHEHLPLLLQHRKAVGRGLAGGVATALLSVGLVLRLLRVPVPLLSSLLPKATTTPIAVAVAARLGGLPSLTAGAVILAGVTGAVLGPALLDRLRVRHPVARGLALGTGSHGIGTARALSESPAAGAAAGSAIVLAGAVTAALAPVWFALLLRLPSFGCPAPTPTRTVMRMATEDRGTGGPTDPLVQAYDEFTGDPYSFASLIERPALEALLGDLTGQTVLDLGCGTGRYTMLLAERGARVTGIDISAAMLEMARARAQASGLPVRLRQADLTALDSLTEEPVDMVFSSAVTHYLPRLEPLMQGMARALRPGGRVLLSVMHPLYTSQHPVARDDNRFPEQEDWDMRYFDRTPRRYVEPWVAWHEELERFLTESYHHTVEDYIMALLGAGLVLTRLLEPRPPEELREFSPSRYEIAIQYPLYMILEARKPASSGHEGGDRP